MSCLMGVRIMPVRPVTRLFGALRDRSPEVTLEEMARAIAEGCSTATIIV